MWRFAIGLVAMGAVCILGVIGVRLGAPASRAPEVSSFVSADEVSGISYDGSSLWLSIDGKGIIQQVDPETGRFQRQIQFPSPATGGSAWDGKFLWQLAYQDKTISRVDLATGRVLGVIPSPGKGMCSGVTFDGRCLWVANFEDEIIYQIDPNQQGKVVNKINGHFETTGLAWDGSCLWSALLVVSKTRQEASPYTGFVLQQDLATQRTKRAIPLTGAGAGSSDWTPGRRHASRFWWYDGYHRRLMRIVLPAEGEGRSAPPHFGSLRWFRWGEG